MNKKIFELIIGVVLASGVAGASAAEVVKSGDGRVSDAEFAVALEGAATAATPTARVESSDEARAELNAATNAVDAVGERPSDMEIDAMLRRIEEQQLYLKTLDHLRAALEKERSIVKLMRECEEFDVVCTGEGLRKIQRIAPSAVTQPPSPPRAMTLPSNLFVAGVVADKVLIRYRGRDMAMRVGERIGGFVVKDIHIDAVTFERGGKRVRVPVARRAKEDE